MKIVIVHYGSGNLRSVQKGFEKIGAVAEISDCPFVIADATHLVVPGVGAFSECMKNLERLNLIKPIQQSIRTGKPYLGICIGLQILFTEGEEFGPCPGLDMIAGKVIRFKQGSLKVPHMGWNQILIQKETPMLDQIPNQSYFYFVHSYYGVPDPSHDVATTTEYGVTFPSAIARDNLFACQFHPEKSQALGLQLLENFTKLK